MPAILWLISLLSTMRNVYLRPRKYKVHSRMHELIRSVRNTAHTQPRLGYLRLSYFHATACASVAQTRPFAKVFRWQGRPRRPNATEGCISHVETVLRKTFPKLSLVRRPGQSCMSGRVGFGLKFVKMFRADFGPTYKITFRASIFIFREVHLCSPRLLPSVK